MVWSLASHHPERCLGVANLCVPYSPTASRRHNLVPLVDRGVYPEAEFPVGQWDYQLFYEENFDDGAARFRGQCRATRSRRCSARAIPAARASPARTAIGARATAAGSAAPARRPTCRATRRVLTEEDLHTYAAALERNGFFGPDSWYMNHAPTSPTPRARRTAAGSTMPVLFLHGAYDYICETIDSRLAEPMRAATAPT